MKQNFDVIIIGAGVAGMTAAIYLKRAGINCCLIEKSMYGGQINLSPKVENYPGFESISGTELSSKIYEQVKNLEIPYINEEVISVNLKNKTKKVILKSKEIISKKIIIATGRHSRKLDVEGANKLVGKGISYCATCDGNLFKQKPVAVIGGGNSAFEEALYLSNICEKVYIIVRTDIIRAEKIYQEKAKKQKNIEIVLDSSLKELKTKDDILDSIVLVNRKTQDIIDLDVKCCFSSIGYEPSSDIFKDIDIDENGYIKVNKNYETNIHGVYAAGDIVKKKIFQLITAMNDGVEAAYACIKMLKKEK